jgi:predicted DNA-binding protein
MQRGENMGKNITVSATVDREMEDKIIALSASTGMSVSEIIRTAIENYLALKEGR